MGVHLNIGADTFPEQSSDVGERAMVVFGYDTTRQLGATIVRADSEAPHITILRLDDGRHVLSTECMYQRR